MKQSRLHSMFPLKNSRSPSSHRFSVRRPFCLAVSVWLVLLLLFQASCFHTYPDLSEADGRRILVRGQILKKEVTASAFRITLGSVQFPVRSGEDSGIYRNLISSIREKWPARGRITVSLNRSSSFSSSGTPISLPSWFRKIRIGDLISVKGKCSLPPEPTNPGQFDEARFCHARNIFLKLSQGLIQYDDMSDIQPERKADARPAAFDARGTVGIPSSGKMEKEKVRLTRKLACLYLNALTDLRFRLKEASAATFGAEDSALIDAIVLGDRSGMDTDTRSLFQDGGILHILAVSSLHVNILGMTVYKLLRKLRRGFLFSSVCSGFLVISYCLLSGGSFSAIRACVMFLLWLGAQITGRTCDRLTSLSAAALLITVFHPYAVSDTGFLLSFCCILSIELLGPVFSRIWPVRSAFAKSLVVSAALQAGILPLTMRFFCQTTPWGILLNLIVLPCMNLFMIFGILGCLAGLLLPIGGIFLFAARMISGPCGILLNLFRLLCTSARRLPGDVLITGCPPLWKVAVYYAALAFGCRITQYTDRHAKRGEILPSRRKIRLSFSASLAGIILLLVLHGRPDFRMTVLDVGQGLCTLVERGNCTLLLDGGSSSVKNVYRSRIESTLKYYGISKLDLVILSHGDTDHTSGVAEMLEGMHPAFSGEENGGIRIEKILIPDLSSCLEEYSGLSDIVLSARRHHIPAALAGEGSSLLADGLQMDVLSPSPGRMTGSTNEDCLVLLLSFRNIRVLCPGDLEKQGEKMFTDAFEKTGFFPAQTEAPGSGRAVKVLLAGHHGSRYATSDELLSLFDPDLVVISCGKNNRYGHPAPAMLDRVRKRGVPIVRTDRSGAFVLSPKR